MSEDIVPHYTPLSQLSPVPRARPTETEAQRAIREVICHPDRYPVRFQRPKKDGRVNVTIALPCFVKGAWQVVRLPLVCTPAELTALAEATPFETSAVGRQLARADHTLDVRRVRRRRSPRLVLKYYAALEAQHVYPAMQTLFKCAAEWPPTLQAMRTRVAQELGGRPTAKVLTAWLIEQLFQPAWQRWGLKRPTENLTLFGSKYLYIRLRHAISPPATWAECVREVEDLLQEVSRG